MPRGSPGAAPAPLATIVLLAGAVYCLVPVLWVFIASTKTQRELFSTFTFAPSTHLFSNIADLSAYRGGLFWRWMANTLLYAGGGAAVSVVVSALAGFALAKYPFPGSTLSSTSCWPVCWCPASSWPSRSTCCWPRWG